MSNKTGAELIAEERLEQIEKHGFNVENDRDYSHGELLEAAMFTIDPTLDCWPDGWTIHFKRKILYKPNVVSRLKIAGAFIAAEIDRLQLKEENE